MTEIVPSGEPRPGSGGHAVDGLIGAAPGLARIAVTAWWRGTGWAVGTGFRLGKRVVGAAAGGESPGEFLTAVGNDLRGGLRGVLGVVDPQGHLTNGPNTAPPTIDAPAAAPRSLPERGAELLRQSADVSYASDIHPAYARILSELAPDEARILRFLAVEGPQPTVDVRTARPFGIASEMVAPGLSMIGSGAGVRFGEKVPAYLNNLFRLGMVWFSREPVADRLRYQVLEAQPDVQTAMKTAGHGRTVRRRIILTPFGEDFCTSVLPINQAAAQLPSGARTPEEKAASDLRARKRDGGTS